MAGLTNVPAAIRDRLQARGMTQAELAARAGISEKHLSQILNGHVTGSHRTLVTLAAAAGFRITVTDEPEVPAMIAVALHVDDSFCRHHGPPLATLPTTPRCSAGLEVNRVLLPGGHIMPITDAAHMFEVIGQHLTAVVPQIARLYAPYVRAWLDGSVLPLVRIALDLADAMAAEAEREEHQGEQVQVFVATTDGRNEVHRGGCYRKGDDDSLTIWAGETEDPDTVVASYGPGEVATYAARYPGTQVPLESAPLPPPVDPCGSGPIEHAGDHHGDSH